MRRLVVLLFVLTACGSTSVPPVATTATAPTTTATTTIVEDGAGPPTSSTTAVPRTPSTTSLADEVSVFVAWVSGSLPEGFAALVSSVEGVEDVTLIAAGIADLAVTFDAGGAVVDTAPEGFAYPLEVFAIDPVGYGRFLPAGEAAVFAGLEQDEVVLGETSARLRGIGVGGRLRFVHGAEVTVAAVLPDALVGGAEVITGSGDVVAPGGLTPRYTLVGGAVTKGALTSAIAAGLEPETPFRVRAEGETPILRHADAVRPQSWIKEQFGEFSYREIGGGKIEIEPGWLEENITEREIPLLGTVKCHRAFTLVLEDVMRSIEASGADVIDPGAFLGCWNPRWIADRRGLSRHAWGVAADINFGNGTEGDAGSPVHPMLLDLMRAAGVTSGHDWAQPDPGHFEWYGDASSA